MMIIIIQTGTPNGKGKRRFFSLKKMYTGSDRSEMISPPTSFLCENHYFWNRNSTEGKILLSAAVTFHSNVINCRSHGPSLTTCRQLNNFNEGRRASFSSFFPSFPSPFPLLFLLSSPLPLQTPLTRQALEADPWGKPHWDLEITYQV